MKLILHNLARNSEKVNICRNIYKVHTQKIKKKIKIKKILEIILDII